MSSSSSQFGNVYHSACFQKRSKKYHQVLQARLAKELGVSVAETDETILSFLPDGQQQPELELAIGKKRRREITIPDADQPPVREVEAVPKKIEVSAATNAITGIFRELLWRTQANIPTESSVPTLACQIALEVYRKAGTIVRGHLLAINREFADHPERALECIQTQNIVPVVKAALDPCIGSGAA